LGHGRDFFLSSPPCPYWLWGPPTLPSNGYRGPSPGIKRLCGKLTIQLLLVSRLRMRGVILPFPQYVFIAW